MARRNTASSNVYTALLAIAGVILLFVLAYTWMVSSTELGLDHPFAELKNFKKLK